MTTSKQILIVGAGLGGLTAAIGLARAGHRVRVFEQAAQLGEVGAGLTLSSGTMRCLEMIGVDKLVRELADESSNLPFLHYRTGEVLRRGLAAVARSGAARPAQQIHRADLHGLLVDALRHIDHHAIHLDHRVTSFESNTTGVSLRFANGIIVHGDLLIGCDGGRSIVRAALTGEPALTFTGQVAFRCLVPMDIARPHLALSTGAVYIGPGATFNRYPLRHGAIMNCVGLARSGAWQNEGWNIPATNAEMLAPYHDWHPEVRALIELAPPQSIIKWGLFVREPLPHWSAGRVSLVGDAAHPMLPFLGLGAAMAIEDGAMLVRAMATHDDVVQALTNYERVRRPRATMIYRESVRQGEIVQGQNPENYANTDSPAHDPAIFDFDPLAVPI